MKKLILANLIITTIFLTSCGVDGTKGLKTTSGTSGISFKVVPKSVLYGNEDDLSKLPSFIEYDVNGPVFHEVDYYENFKIPKTDITCNTVGISPSDQEFFNKTSNTLGTMLIYKIPRNKTLTEDKLILKDYRQNVVVTNSINPYIVGFGLVCEDYIRNIFLSNVNMNRIINKDYYSDYKYTTLMTGSVIFIDSDYNFEIWKLEDSQLKLHTRLALNPDDYELYKKENSTLEYFLSTMKMHARDLNNISGDETTKGFIWSKIGILESKVNGKTVNMPLSLEYKDGILMCPFFWFIKQLDSAAKTKYTNGQMTVEKTFRFYDDADDYKMHETYTHIVLNVGSNKILVNKLPIDLTMTPYEKDGELMVPLEDICKYLGAEYHFRPIDNTVLIARFPMSDCR